MTAVPHPIPYQGSKRRLAAQILEHFPAGVTTIVEPFSGSAALSLAAAQRFPGLQIQLNDSLAPLAELWRLVLSTPEALGEQYAEIWQGQKSDPLGHYNAVRTRYNQSQAPAALLFLLARCVKNAVRFNADGHFNQSPDKRRRGTHPDTMSKSIAGASELLRGRTRVQSGDFEHALQGLGPQHLVYLDPPYQGTSGSKDRRYHQGLDLPRFIAGLEKILETGAHLIVSFDGRCGPKQYGTDLPTTLGLSRLEVAAGRSSQATLNGRSDSTFESLYLSSSCR